MARTKAATGEFSKRNLVILGAVIGFLYGFGLRILANSSLSHVAVMTMGFTCLMPFAMGCITVYFAEIGQPRRVWTWIWLPWVPLLAALGATMLALLEGLICVAMFAPLAMILASLGGLLGGLAARLIRSHRARRVTMACVMALPLVTAPWEKQVLYRLEEREVENVIDIKASPEVIWRNIASVRAIRPEELPASWSHRIGFPDPVEATLSHEGVGGVRNATFTGGLYFLETVDVWKPQQRLGFTIAAQTDLIPPTTLDEHVRVGGPYFDVLRGEYRLEPMANGTIRLHLSSRHRVSTNFNWYAHLWTDAIMSDLQKRILVVIRQRCEAQPARARDREKREPTMETRRKARDVREWPGTRASRRETLIE
ncbi:MAG TPA: hypothetical protein VFQ41_24130 [Candidatus Angelobacter sp.]|nr:hypothetical protein [Candidatus Angelobacter sp.]